MSFAKANTTSSDNRFFFPVLPHTVFCLYAVIIIPLLYNIFPFLSHQYYESLNERGRNYEAYNPSNDKPKKSKSYEQIDNQLS